MNVLSDNEINEEVADLLGFERPYRFPEWADAYSVDSRGIIIPYFSSSLDATSMFEPKLFGQLEDYWSELSYICQRDFNKTGNKLCRQAASATARQRCEAFIAVKSREKK